MKREKEIRKIANTLIDPYESCIDWEYERGLKEGFIRGAQWADENPKYGMVKLDKVIEWIQENTIKDFDNKNLTMLFGSTIDMIDDLRKRGRSKLWQQ